MPGGSGRTSGQRDSSSSLAHAIGFHHKEDYLARVDRRLQELIAEGWFLSEYADPVLADARAARIP